MEFSLETVVDNVEILWKKCCAQIFLFFGLCDLGYSVGGRSLVPVPVFITSPLLPIPFPLSAGPQAHFAAISTYVSYELFHFHKTDCCGMVGRTLPSLGMRAALRRVS